MPCFQPAVVNHPGATQRFKGRANDGQPDVVDEDGDAAAARLLPHHFEERALRLLVRLPEGGVGFVAVVVEVEMPEVPPIYRLDARLAYQPQPRVVGRDERRVATLKPGQPRLSEGDAAARPDERRGVVPVGVVHAP